jgi:hypothetical protein
MCIGVIADAEVNQQSDFVSVVLGDDLPLGLVQK